MTKIKYNYITAYVHNYVHTFVKCCNLLMQVYDNNNTDKVDFTFSHKSDVWSGFVTMMYVLIGERADSDTQIQV